MIIVKLIAASKEQSAAIADNILKNKYTLNVFGSTFDSYHLNSLNLIEHTEVYVIQFVTKILLINEIEAALKKDFPESDFSFCATPIVHMAFNLQDKIRKRVLSVNPIKEKTEG